MSALDNGLNTWVQSNDEHHFTAFHLTGDNVRGSRGCDVCVEGSRIT